MYKISHMHLQMFYVSIFCICYIISMMSGATNLDFELKSHLHFQCRIDDTGIYHGHSGGVNKHSMADGSIIWSQKSASSNMFGVQVLMNH